MANSVGPDEAAPLIWVCTICSELFIKIITFLGNSFQALSKALVYIHIYKQQENLHDKNNGVVMVVTQVKIM